MSLHNAAKHLAAHGRGPDTTLVHMTPREVAGLQAIAKAHGGSLTINPHTGLAEAGFLRNLLPTIAGAALAATGVGAPMAAAMIGGAAGLAKGDLKAGLMAGLGAYGGAGMTSGLMTAGSTEAAKQAAVAETAGQAGQAEAAGQAAQAAAVPTPAPATPPATSPGMASSQQIQQAQANLDWGQSAKDYASNQAGNTNELVQATNNQVGIQPANTGFTEVAQPPKMSAFDKIKLGAETSAKDPSKFVQGMGGGKDAVYYTGATVAPHIPEPEKPVDEENDPKNPLNRYKFDPDKYRSADRSQPDPYYTPVMYRYGYAEGGTVEQMSNANAVGQNTGYPMANMHQGAYATPWQTPTSQNVVEGTADTGVNRMTGEQSFAAGGITGTGGIDVHVPLSIGSGGQGSQNGYTPAGGTQQYTPQQGGTVQQGASQAPRTGGISGLGGMTGQQIQQLSSRLFGGDYMGAEPQGMNQTQLQGLMRGFAAGPQSQQTYEQYLAARSPVQQDVPLTKEQFNASMGPNAAAAYKQLVGFTGNNPASAFAQGGMAFARGGQSDLGSYSDGGRMLKGPGDGMSDSIPAKIGAKQPARLADGEFVVPADVVSHLGNGSSDAGAKQLYAMMDRIRTRRTGKKKQAPQVNPKKAMPA